MLYHIVLASREDLKSQVCRLKVDDVLRITCLPGIEADAVKISAGEARLQEFTSEEPLCTKSVEVRCDRSGPLRVSLLSGDEEVGALNYLVHSAIVERIEGLSLVSVITQKLGPLSNWEATLKVLERQRFSAIHFTPVQELGASRSSYSIADHLKLSPAFQTSWEDLAQYARKTICEKYGMYSFCDIVLNHIASSAPVLNRSPQIGYNEINTPWLKGAIALDNVFKKFTKDLVDGAVVADGGRKLSASVNSPQDIEQLVQTFTKQYLNSPAHGFSHRNWYTLDVERTIENYKQLRNGSHSPRDAVPTAETPLGEIVDGVGSFTDAVRRLVGERENFAIRGDILAHYASSERHARDLVAWAQQALWKESSEAYGSAIDALRGTLTYERLEQKKGPITYEPWNSVVPWYFTTVTVAENRTDAAYEVGREYALANNGWVMGWSGERGFIERGGNVYLKRSLVAWSDCVKLRYGEPRAERYEHCPELWKLVEDYAVLSAKTFHGFRLDNCHTTPIAVARHVLAAARQVRPNLFVFAELFTGSEKADLMFEETLGIDALVREAIQTSSPGDEAYHAVKYSTAARQFARLERDTQLGRTFESSSKAPTPGRSANIFYDCTHDNETCLQKKRLLDALASAGIVTASGCAVGSTYGYELLVKTNPSVLADGTTYPSQDVKLPEAEKIATGKETEAAEPDDLPPCPEGHTLITHSTARATAEVVSLWGAHNGWFSSVEMKKSKKGVWYTFVETERLSLGKFVTDGQWECSGDYETVRDERGNENNMLLRPRVHQAIKPAVVKPDLDRSSGLIEARRVLNEIHSGLATYPEISISHLADDLVCISRFRPCDGHAYHFVIRSGWWSGNARPAQDSCAIMGRVIGDGPVLCARMRPDWLDHSDRWAVARRRSAISELSSRPKEWYTEHTDLTWLTLGHDFPSGSICVYQTLVDRADAAIERLIDEVEKATPDGLDMSLIDLNALLWSCDQEERDRSNGQRGVYVFPGVRDVVFAGVMGVVDAMKTTRQNFPEDFQQQGIYKNVVDGDWLMDYQLSRAQDLFGTGHAISKFLKRAHQLITATKRPETKARAVELLFSYLSEVAVKKIAHGNALGTKDPIVQSLLLAATQVVGKVKSARMNEWEEVSVSAGLPFFTTGYMREWGRDTMLAIFGLCAPLNRWALMRSSILCYARVIRHGLTPNLLDSSTKPRYNARDAVHFWLNAIQRYVLYAPEGPEILKDTVYVKYAHGLGYQVPMLKHQRCQHADGGSKVSTEQPAAHEYCIPLSDCIRYVLFAHYNGISFREWNAGEAIDSQMTDEGFNVQIKRDPATGFCLGGNRHNCGTWMDKMGSSAKAGNKGVPASPRDGAPVELTLALYSTLSWVVREHSAIGLDADELAKYTAWRDQIKANFVSKYLIVDADAARWPNIAVAGTFKDVYGGAVEEEDYYLRCNYSIGLGLCMDTDIVPKCIAIRALLIAQERLVGEPEQLGMKTLCPKNPKYQAKYNNSDDSSNKLTAHGWNYHQGPEWVWPYGFWYEAVWRYLSTATCASAPSTVAHVCVSTKDVWPVRALMSKSLDHIAKRLWSGPWFSLPEITHPNGEVCPDGCQAQAWSIAGFLSYVWLARHCISQRQALPASTAESREDIAVLDKKIAEDQPEPDCLADSEFQDAEESKDDGSTNGQLQSIILPEEAENASPTSSIPRAADFIMSDDEEDQKARDSVIDIHSVKTAERL